MWLFTKRGFLSIVRKEGDHVDNSTYVVRARSQEHIANYFLPTRIIKTDKADYAYRAEVNHHELLDLMREICDEIDYDNFKNACKDDDAYHTLLDKVWALHFYYQLETEDFRDFGVGSDPTDTIVRRLSKDKDPWPGSARNPGRANTDQHGTSGGSSRGTQARIQVPSGGSPLDSDGRQSSVDHSPVQPWYRRLFGRW